MKNKNCVKRRRKGDNLKAAGRTIKGVGGHQIGMDPETGTVPIIATKTIEGKGGISTISMREFMYRGEVYHGMRPIQSVFFR